MSIVAIISHSFAYGLSPTCVRYLSDPRCSLVQPDPCCPVLPIAFQSDSTGGGGSVSLLCTHLPSIGRTVVPSERRTLGGVYPMQCHLWRIFARVALGSCPPWSAREKSTRPSLALGCSVTDGGRCIVEPRGHSREYLLHARLYRVAAGRHCTVLHHAPVDRVHPPTRSTTIHGQGRIPVCSKNRVSFVQRR